MAASFNLPLTGDSQTVFIKNISKDLIGISTQEVEKQYSSKMMEQIVLNIL